MRTVIVGKVNDAETDNPIENAIVFLSNTPLGNSSGADGTFNITNVPPGTHQLIISHVGYRRQVIPVEVTQRESLFYDVKLEPRPVQNKEVEILGERIADANSNHDDRLLFSPAESPNTYCVYGTNETNPIGIFFADSAFYMYALDTAIIDSEKYIRLWLLYKNSSRTPYDFNPMKCISLDVRGKKYSYRGISPASPSEILTHLGIENAVVSIAERVEKPLETFADQHGRFRDAEESFILRNGGIVWGIHDISPADGASPQTLYNTLKNSICDGILKRYTVYPGNSVNGYLYFSQPGLHWKASEAPSVEISESVYTIVILTQSGSKSIDFTLH